MKQLLRRPATIDKTMTRIPAPVQLPSMKEDPNKPRYTLRLEDGIVHINNISGTPEAITYTLMAQKPDGGTELVTRHVALAPFQVIEDEADGLNVLAAWTKN